MPHVPSVPASPRGRTPAWCCATRARAASSPHRLLPAFDSQSRRTGLLKHTSLDEGEAMLIAPTNAVHTWFMKFDIDIAFVTRDGRVLKARDTVRPWRMTGAFGGFAVIEMKAGSFSAADTVRGDRLEIVEP